MNKTIGTIIKASLVTASLVSAVCRGTYGCLGWDGNGTPPPLQLVGQTPNGIDVHQDDSNGTMYALLDGIWREIINAGGKFLYRDGGLGIAHDGQGNFYDEQGKSLQSVGQLADGNPVYPTGEWFFAVIDNKSTDVIQLRNGHFVYDSFKRGKVWVNPHTFREYHFDGQNWFDSYGDAWDGKGTLVDKYGNVLQQSF
jgi:hypothetical protein